MSFMKKRIHLGNGLGHGIKQRELIADCVNHYRHHEPAINLPDSHHAILNRLGQQYPLYLVTDGHKVVQEKSASIENKTIFSTYPYYPSVRNCECKAFEVLLRTNPESRAM